MFDFLFIGNTKRLENRLNVRSYVRIISENNIKKSIWKINITQIILNQ